MRSMLLVLGLIVIPPATSLAQDRDTKVRNDRATFGKAPGWIYNDLDEGIRVATREGKPLFVVFRCIPCEACQEFDDEVARRDPIIRDMLDQYVCVRIVQANTLDLAHFQDDYDQSFAVFLMNPDLTIYGRFGTRSGRPEPDDITLQGLRKALEAALRIHRDFERVKPSLACKQVTPGRYKTPRDYPSLAGKYGETINYEGPVARSCMHCHQIRDAERLVYRTEAKSIPDEVLFPYPDPDVLGLRLKPDDLATVERVEPGTPAEAAGFRKGDEIVTLGEQPLLSIADLQWVLQNAPATVKLPADVRRDGAILELTLDLRDGWRRGDISWRATTWELRRMGLGGMLLEDLNDAQRRDAGLSSNGMALRARHIGEFGDHAIAKRAGLQKGDIVVAFDGKTDRMTESQLLAHALQRKRPGDPIVLSVLRDGERKTFTFTLP